MASGTGSLFGSTQELRNIYFNRAVPYLNQPAVGTNPSTATRQQGLFTSTPHKKHFTTYRFF